MKKGDRMDEPSLRCQARPRFGTLAALAILLVSSRGLAQSETTDEAERERLERLERRIADLSDEAERAQRDSFDATFLSPAAVRAALAHRRVSSVVELFRQHIGFEPYEGRVRGARGALFSHGGNSIDVALAVAGVLDEIHVSWRLVRGQLDDEQAAQLLRSIAPAASMSGSDAEAAGFEPGGTPWRRRLVADHWWVEAEVDDTWVPVDPLYPGLTDGAAATEPTERFATGEVPSLLDHRVTLRLIRRQGMLPRQTVLTYSADLAALSYRNLALSFVPQGPRHYRPSLSTGEGTIEGDVFERETAERIWLEFEFGYGRSTHRVRHELRDAREPHEAFASGVHVFSILFLPGWVGPDYFAAVSGALLGELSTHLGELRALVATSGGSAALGQTHFAKLVEILSGMTGLVGLSFANASDDMTQGLAYQSGVRAWFPRPRIVVVGAAQRADGLAFRLDLADDSAETLPFAGVPARLASGFHALRGRAESALTGEVLRSLTGLDVLTASVLLTSAHEAGIPFATISPQNTRNLSRLGLSDWVAERIEADVTGGGGVVITPEDPITVGGGQRSAWWLVQSTTGSISAILDDGTRGAVAGFLASGQTAPSDGVLRALDTLEQLTTVSESLFAGVRQQMREGRQVRDEACQLACEVRWLEGEGCGSSADATLDQCLRAPEGGDDPLALGLSCREMFDAFRCGSVIGAALVTGSLRVEPAGGAPAWGPWSTVRDGLRAAPGCRCPL